MGTILEEPKLVGKIAADKESKKLGRIIKIENIKDQKTKIPKPNVLILVSKPLRKDIVILIEVSKLLREEAEYAWFDIFKKDFDQEVRETRALINL